MAAQRSGKRHGRVDFGLSALGELNGNPDIWPSGFRPNLALHSGVQLGRTSRVEHASVTSARVVDDGRGQGGGRAIFLKDVRLAPSDHAVFVLK